MHALFSQERRGISTFRHFIMVIVDASLHHPGSGLTLLGCAPLVRHSRGLELNYNLLEAQGTQTMSDPCAVGNQVFN